MTAEEINNQLKLRHWPLGAPSRRPIRSAFGRIHRAWRRSRRNSETGRLPAGRIGSRRTGPLWVGTAAPDSLRFRTRPSCTGSMLLAISTMRRAAFSGAARGARFGVSRQQPYSAQRITIFTASSGNSRASTFASPHGARPDPWALPRWSRHRLQMYSSTTAFGEVVMTARAPSTGRRRALPY